MDNVGFPLVVSFEWGEEDGDGDAREPLLRVANVDVGKGAP